VFNVLSSYIKTEFDNPKKFKVVLQNFLRENSFFPWMSILNFKKVKYSHMIWIDIFKVLARMFLLLIFQSVSYIFVSTHN